MKKKESLGEKLNSKFEIEYNSLDIAEKSNWLPFICQPTAQMIWIKLHDFSFRETLYHITLHEIMGQESREREISWAKVEPIASFGKRDLCRDLIDYLALILIGQNVWLLWKSRKWYDPKRIMTKTCTSNGCLHPDRHSLGISLSSQHLVWSCPSDPHCAH